MLTKLLNDSGAMTRQGTNGTGCIDADRMTFKIEMHEPGGLANQFTYEHCLSRPPVPQLDDAIELLVGTIDACATP